VIYKWTTINDYRPLHIQTEIHTQIPQHKYSLDYINIRRNTDQNIESPTNTQQWSEYSL